MTDTATLIAALRAASLPNSGEIADLLESLNASLASAQSEISAAVSRHMDEMNAVNATASTAQTALDAATARVTELTQQVEGMNTQLVMGNTQLQADCDAAVRAKEDRIRELEQIIEHMAETPPDVSDLLRQITELKSQAEAAATALATSEAARNEAQATLAETQRKFDAYRAANVQQAEA